MLRPGAGQRIGPYTLLEPIAQGGQGALFKARDHLGRDVALKVLLSPNPRQVQRFVQEGRVLARLDHPNLPKVFGVAEEQGVPCLAMELIAGEDLKSIVGRTGPDPAWAVEVLGTVARVLEHCHEHGVVHRDLKPQNILIEAGTGRPVLVDFGLARPLGAEYQHLSRTGETLGTPAYMAPEQCDTEFGEVGPRTDVYGLGAVLYFLLTREPPFLGATAYNVILKVIRDAPPDPRAVNPAVAESLALLCQRAMSKDPAERPASAGEFVEALQVQTAATPVAAAGSGRAWIPLVLLPLLLLVGVAVWIWRGAGEEAAAPPVPAQEKQAAKKPPSPADLLLARGQEREERKDIQGALEDYRQAIELEPDGEVAATAIQRLVNMCEKRPRYLNQAEAACRRLLALAPRNKYATLQLGDVYKARRQHEAALALFNEAIAIDGEYYWAHVKRGQMRAKTGDLEGARADYRRATQLEDPTTDDGFAAWRNLGHSLYDARKRQEAIGPYSEALRRKPTAHVHRRRGWCYYEAKRYDEAIADYTRAIELQPAGFYQRYHRGLAYKAQGRFPAAVADFRLALQQAREIARRALDGKSVDRNNTVREKIPLIEGYLLDLPKRPPGRLPPGEMLRLELAQEYLDGVVERLKTNGWVRSIRGRIRGQQGDVQGALADYRRALELERGTWSETIKRLVDACYHTWRRADDEPQLHLHFHLLDPAEAACKWVLEQDPKHVVASFRLAEVYRLRQQHEAAIRQYGRTIDLDPNHDQAYLWRAELRQAQGEVAGAIADYRAAARLRPQDSRAWVKLADLLFWRKRWVEALKLYSQVLQINPRDHDAWRRRGLCYQKLQKPELAIADLDKAIALAPDSFWARYHRGRGHNVLGRSAQARADFEHALRVGERMPQKKSDVRRAMKEMKTFLHGR